MNVKIIDFANKDGVYGAYVSIDDREPTFQIIWHQDGKYTISTGLRIKGTLKHHLLTKERADAFIAYVEADKRALEGTEVALND